MWTEIFKERIRIEKVEKKKLAELIGMSETAFHKGFKNESFKFQNILKVYNHFNWDLNELKGDNISIVSNPETYFNKTKTTEQNASQQIENIKRIYESHILSLKDEIEILKRQLEFLQEIIRKPNGNSGGAHSNAG